MARAYIGLGSNLDDPLAQVQRALERLAELPDTRLIGQSRLYRSAPVGPEGQPDYINAVACLETALSPEILLDHLQQLEHQQGRVRTLRWGPRTLDLDILLYDALVLQTPRLTLPHPEMINRSFVLYPLADLAPDLILPTGQSLQSLLDGCPSTGLSVISVA